MAHKTLFLSAALLMAGRTVAQSSSVVSLILPSVNQKEILASVVAVEATATQYALACPSKEGDTFCGLGDGMMVKEGPSTFEQNITMTAHSTSGGADTYFGFTAHGACALSSDTASCTWTAFNEEGDGKTTSTETAVNGTVITGISSFIVPVTITAGLEKLTGGTAAPSTTAGGPSTTGNGSPTSTSSSRAGVPRMTQPAVLAGVAAVVGGAALMV